MTDTLTPQDGIYYGVPATEYRQWRAWSWSTLKHGLLSMAHIRAYLDDDKPYKQTRSQYLGTMAHMACLEPRLFNIVVEIYDGTRRGKAWEEFQAANENAVIMTQEDYDLIIDMQSAFQNDLRVIELTAFAQREVSYIWTDPDTGLRCKARADMLTGDTLIDYKTTSKGVGGQDFGAWKAGFERQMGKLAYDGQLAHYQDGLRILDGVERKCYIVAQELGGACLCAVLPVDPAYIVYGLGRRNKVLQQVAACETTGVWPGWEYTPEDAALTVPRWANEAELVEWEMGDEEGITL